ncbi:hypothetical protein, partial [Pigmentiphaga sp. NML080357]|uniref:hypothetical protein n=1 Tax=Pigmentiphaga sp. NML080357 TaxID=2008675 RepID=UPI001E4D7FB8
GAASSAEKRDYEGVFYLCQIVSRAACLPPTCQIRRATRTPRTLLLMNRLSHPLLRNCLPSFPSHPTRPPLRCLRCVVRVEKETIACIEIGTQIGSRFFVSFMKGKTADTPRQGSKSAIYRRLEAAKIFSRLLVPICA